MKSRTCQMCGGELGRYERCNKRFCDQNCRKAWSRRKDEYKKKVRAAQYALSGLRQMIKKYPDLQPEINEQLKWLRSETTDMLRLSDRATIEEEGARDQMLSSYHARS